MSAYLAAEIVKERTGRPNATGYEWKMLRAQTDGIDGFEVSIADVPPYKTGEKAGQPNYRLMTNRQTMIVALSDFDAWVEAWEASDPANCRQCSNAREVFVRWDHIEGVTMRPCPCAARFTATPDDDMVADLAALLADDEPSDWFSEWAAS